MSEIPSRRIAALAVLFTTVAGLAGCDGPTHPPPPMPLTITIDSAGTAAIPIGQDAVFTVVVKNPTSSEVKNVSFFAAAGLNLGAQSVTCTAQGATCPATGSSAIASIPAGGVLTFTVTAVVQGNPITENVGLSADAYQAISVQGHATIANAADGAYVGDVADGSYIAVGVDLTDHRAGVTAETFDGNGATWHDLSTNADGSLVTTAGMRLRVVQDVVVGSNDWGAGQLPFLVFRQPVASISELDGQAYNTFERTLPAGGAAFTRAFATWFTGSTMNVCVDPFPYSAAACPGASQRHYALTSNVSGAFTATDAGSGDVQKFWMVHSGTSTIIMRGETLPAASVFAIGLRTDNGPASATFGGGSTRGSWDQLTLTATSYSARSIAPDGTLGSPIDNATLAAPANASPGLVQGPRTSDGATLLLAADGSLAVAVGARDGTASGELHLYAK